MNKRSIYILVIVLITKFVYPNSGLDSLYQLFVKERDSDKKAVYLLDYARELKNSNLDSAQKCIKRIYDAALLNVNEPIQAESILELSYCEETRGNYKVALKYQLLAANLFSKNKNKKGLARTYTSMGITYWYLGMYSQAKDYIYKNIILSNELKDINGIAASYGNLAIIFDEQSNNDSALHYYNKALEIYKQGDNAAQLASCYDNMSLIFLNTNNFKKAIEFHTKGFEIRKQIQDTIGIMASLENLGKIYVKLNKPEKAIEVSNQVLNIARRLDAKEDVKFALYNLKDAYILKNDVNSAYKIMEELMELKDQLRNQENLNQIAELEARFKNKENEKELNEIRLEQKLKDQENENYHKKKNFIIIILVISGISFLIISFLGFKRFKDKKKVADELQLKNEAISSQKIIIDKAYSELAEINKDITDSIRYAKRIQEAIFPSETKIKKCLRDYFIFFQPKDIVSGDFYWIEQTKDSVYIAVVDCTGHGVPGAFMSIVGESLLSKALLELNLHSPADILNRVNKDLDITLKQSKEANVVRDGMEISLIQWNYVANTLIFAGANLNLYQVSNMEMKFHQGDKQPIGATYSNEEVIFQNKHIDFLKGDAFYLLSDGFPDQFGGPRGKKFKYKQLEEKLLSISMHSMEEQSKELSSCFNEWKGDLEQLDDVLIIGLRL